MAEEKLLLKTVKFEANDILTRGKLQALYDYPRDMFSLLFGGYGQGIIAGLDFWGREDGIWLTPGLVHLGDHFYSLRHSVSLTGIIRDFLESHEARGHVYHIVLETELPYEEDGVLASPLAMKVKSSVANDYDELQICGFSDQSMPELPPVDGVNECRELYSLLYLQLLDTSWAMRNGATFHPYVFRIIAKLLMNAPRKTPLEYALLLELQKSGVLPMESLAMYAGEHGFTWPESADRKEIFKIVCECIARERPLEASGESSRKTTPEPTPETRRRMWLDEE